MTPDPKQLACEMAEKCAESWFPKSTPGQFISKAEIEQAKEDFVVVILRELNLEQLIADKQRLDWLGDVEGGPSAEQFEKFFATGDANELRQAIDNAMKEEQK